MDKRILRVGEDGEVVEGASPDEVVESMGMEDQTTSIESMEDDMASDAMEMETEAEECEQAMLAAQAALGSLGKKGGVDRAKARKLAAQALESYDRLSNLIDRTHRRAGSTKRIISKLSKVSASRRDQTSRKASEVLDRVNKVSEMFVGLKRQIETMKPKLATLFDQQDDSETLHQDYGEYDFKTDVQPDNEQEAADTIEETKTDPEEGWYQQRPGLAANKRRNRKHRKRPSFGRRALRKIFGEGAMSMDNELRSDEAAIPAPGQADEVEVDMPNDTGIENVQDMMADDVTAVLDALKGKRMRHHRRRLPRGRRAVYNDDPEYLEDTDVQENVEDMAGPADDDAGDMSEPGMVMGRRKRMKARALAKRRRMFAEEGSTEDLADQLEDALENMVPGDIDIEMEDDESDSETKEARRRRRTRAGRGRGRGSKISARDWRLIERIAEGEESKEDDEDESDDDSESETKEARRRRRTRAGRRPLSRKRSNKSRSTRISRSDRDAMELCRRIVKQAEEEGMDDDMEETSMQYGEETVMDGELETGMEDREAAQKGLTIAVKRRSAKMNQAMRLVALEQLRGLRPSELHSSLVDVLASEANVSAQKADRIIRTAMAHKDSYHQFVEGLIKEAEKVIEDMPDDKQFLNHYKRIASMNGVHDRMIEAGQDEESVDVESWETSEVYNQSVASEKTASRSGGSVDEIIGRAGLIKLNSN